MEVKRFQIDDVGKKGKIGRIHRVAVFPAASHGALDGEGVQEWRRSRIDLQKLLDGPVDACELKAPDLFGVRVEQIHGTNENSTTGNYDQHRPFCGGRSSHRRLPLKEITWTITQRVGQRFCANVGIRNLPGDGRCWKRDSSERGIVTASNGLRFTRRNEHEWSPLQQRCPYQVDRPRRG